MTKKLMLVLCVFLLIFVPVLSGCNQADRVSYNVSQQANSFNVSRKLTVINQRTDTILFEMRGNFSVKKEKDGDLAVTGENADGTFYKHFICLSSEIAYVVEDMGHTDTSKYQYEINFNPKMSFTFKPVIID